jgi:catechol 2,3-dioxygenase-like lactoylglutathione lyase family enzyme
MQFSQIQHCSLAVQDLERAAAFYRDVLGLLEIAIPSTFPAAGLNVRWFQIGGQQIHLLLESATHPPSGRHLALQVDDAQAARRHLHAKGIGIDEAVLIPGADRFFITDPDGNRIEIIEWKEAHVAVPVSEQLK